MDEPDTTPAVVLVVEDEALLRLLVFEILEEAGFEVIEACTADDAVVVLVQRSEFEWCSPMSICRVTLTVSNSRETCKTIIAGWASLSVRGSAALRRRISLLARSFL